MKFDKVISLGTCCACSFIIKRIFPEQLRHPFDWLSVNEVKCVSCVLRENFSDFTVESKETLPWRPSETSSKLCSGRYPIWAVHGYNPETLNRRIERFRKNVESDENILFVIVGHVEGNTPMYCCPSIEMKDTLELRDTLYTLKKDRKFHLCVINGSAEPRERIKMENLSINYVDDPLDKENLVINCGYEGNHDEKLKNIFKEIELEYFQL